MAVPIEKLRDQWREATRKYRKANRERVNASASRQRALNPEKHKAAVQKWRKANPERAASIQKRGIKKWNAKNPHKLKAYQRKWATANREYINLKERQRLAADPSYRLARCLRARTRAVLKRRGATKSDKTFSLTGCSIQFLLGHLEAGFKIGMSWANYGRVWEVDHILPCAMFDLESESEQRVCFHYTNLQPLFTLENRRKHSKLPKD